MKAIGLQLITSGKSVKKGGDKAIQKWINDQMSGRSCAIVLIGRTTAGRKWINYEIQQAWADGKGLLGIHVHNLEDKNGKQTTKGRNPFEDLKVNGVNLSRIVSAYDPPRSTSTGVYGYISDHLADWVESAILTRNRY